MTADRPDQSRPDRERPQERPLRDGRGRAPSGDVADDPRAARRVPHDRRTRGASMVVGQFGSYIPEVIDGFGGRIDEGDVILLNDPYLCKGSISHCNDWLVIVPIFHEGELVGFSSLFGHMMDVGGAVPGSQVADALLDLGRGAAHPARSRSSSRASLNETALADHPQQHPDAGHEPLATSWRSSPPAAPPSERVVDICDRFGRDTYTRACEALLERTRHGMVRLIRRVHPRGAGHVLGLGRRRRARQRPVQDGADRSGARGTSPLRLDGDRSPGPGLDQLPHPRGPVQDVLRGLPDHGLRPRDPLQRGLLRRVRGDAARRARCSTRAFPPRSPTGSTCTLASSTASRARSARSTRPLDGGRLRHQPLLRVLRLRRGGEYFQLVELLFGGLPGAAARRTASTEHSWWPLFRTTPAEYMEAYYPVVIERYRPVRDSGGAGCTAAARGSRRSTCSGSRRGSRSTTTGRSSKPLGDRRRAAGGRCAKDADPRGRTRSIGCRQDRRHLQVDRRATASCSAPPARAAGATHSPGRPKLVGRDVRRGSSPGEALKTGYGVVVGDRQATEKLRSESLRAGHERCPPSISAPCPRGSSHPHECRRSATGASRGSDTPRARRVRPFWSRGSSSVTGLSTQGDTPPPPRPTACPTSD